MPSSGYAINETKSYCTIDNKTKDTNAVLKTVNGSHSFSNLAKQDKCYLYFDKSNSGGSSIIEEEVVKNTTLGTINIRTDTPDFIKRAGDTEVSVDTNKYFTYADIYEYDETTKNIL